MDGPLGGAEDHICSTPDTEAMRATESSAAKDRVGLFMVAAQYSFGGTT